MTMRPPIAALVSLMLVCGIASAEVHLARVPPSLEHALRNGDRAQVERIEKQFHVMPELRRYFDALLDFDLPTAIRAATRCRDKAYRAGKTGLARYCNANAWDAAYVSGNAHEMVALTVWRMRIKSKIEALHNRISSAHNPASQQITDLSSVMRTLPPLTATIGRQRVVLANLSVQLGRTRDDRQDGNAAAPATDLPPPTVSVVINGHRLKATLDTGSNNALQMDASTARQLHLKPISVGGTPATGQAFREINGKTRVTPHLEVADQFRLGALTMRHLMVEVVPDNYDSSVVIGLGTLARFRQVTFDRSRVVLGMTVSACTTSIPITFQAGSGFAFPAKADGMAVKGWVDTGNYNFLSAMRKLARDGATPTIRPNTRLTRANIAYARYLSVSFGPGGKYHVDTLAAPVYTNINGPGPDFLIGPDILGSWDVRFTFSKPGPSLCLLPRPEAEPAARTG